MSEFSLRLPYLIYLSIGAMLFGVLIAPAVRDLPDAMPLAEAPGMPAGQMAAMHPARDVEPEAAPSLSLTVDKDPKEGWNLTLTTENFTFDPTAAGKAPVPNTGHAHLYVDGVKIARLYGPHFHIPDLAPGTQRRAVIALERV